MNRMRAVVAAGAIGAVLGAAAGITGSVVMMLTTPFGPMTMYYGSWAGAIAGAVAGPFARRRSWVGAGLAGAIAILAARGAMELLQVAVGSWSPERLHIVAMSLPVRSLITFAAFALFPAIWSRLAPYVEAD